MLEELREQIRQIRQAEEDLNNPSDARQLDLIVSAWRDVQKHPDFDRLSSEDRAWLLAECAQYQAQLGFARQSLSEIDQALEHYERASAITPDSEDRSRYIIAQARALRLRFALSDDIADLDRAIAKAKQVASTTEADSIALHYSRVEIANAFAERYRKGDNLSDLDESIAWREMAVSEERFDWWPLRDNAIALAQALLTRQRITLNKEDLDRAISVARRAVAEVPEEGPQSEHLSVLAQTVLRRYEIAGREADLDEAIECTEAAFAASSLDEITYRQQAQSLIDARLIRWHDQGSPNDLDAAIRINRQIYDRASTDSERRVMGVELAYLLLDREAAFDDAEALATAITVLEEARAAHRGSDLAIEAQRGLAEALRRRYRRNREQGDIDHAVELARSAVDTAPAHSLQLAAAHLVLAECLRDRFHSATPPVEGFTLYFGRYEDRRDALDAYRTAARLGLDLAPDLAIDAALRWGKWESELDDWGRAAEAYRYGLQGLHVALQRPSRRRKRERLLLRAAGLSTRGAYALAATGDLIGALIALERGRAVLTLGNRPVDWSKTWPEDVWAIDSERAALYQSQYEQWQAQLSDDEVIIRQLDAMAGDPLINVDLVEKLWAVDDDAKITDPSPPIDAQALSPRAAALADLQAVTRQGPLIYIVSSVRGGLALVAETSGQVRAVWLQDLDELSVLDHVRRFESAYTKRNESGGREVFRATLMTISEWLWESLVGPLEDLYRDSSYISLVATGFLGLLPIHAASTADAQAPTGRRYATDIFTCSYIPSARALRDAQEIQSSLNQSWVGELSESTHRLSQVPLDTSSDFGWQNKDAQIRHSTGLTSLFRDTRPRGLFTALGRISTVLISLPGKIGRYMRKMAAGRTTQSAERNTLGLTNPCDQQQENAQINGREAWRAALVIDEPKPTSQEPLKYSRYECELANGLCEHVTALRDSECTVEAVLSQMPRRDLLHFSCHGIAELMRPFDSHLVLSNDTPLRVQDLELYSLATCRLAILSACESAKIGADLPDEVIGLPISLLAAGIPGIVGTLWAIPGPGALFVMIRFYELLKLGYEPALALCAAQRWVRDTRNRDKINAIYRIFPLESAHDEVLKELLIALKLAPEARGFAALDHWAAFMFTGA
jgi:tetratricopeptide (TPR) repeat protein